MLSKCSSSELSPILLLGEVGYRNGIVARTHSSWFYSQQLSEKRLSLAQDLAEVCRSVTHLCL
jgi:hypothetical protein